MPAPHANSSHEYGREEKKKCWRIFFFRIFWLFFIIRYLFIGQYSHSWANTFWKLKWTSKIVSTRAIFSLAPILSTEKKVILINFSKFFDLFGWKNCNVFASASTAGDRMRSFRKQFGKRFAPKMATKKKTEQTVLSSFPLRPWECVLMVRKLCKVNQRYAT